MCFITVQLYNVVYSSKSTFKQCSTTLTMIQWWNLAAKHLLKYTWRKHATVLLGFYPTLCSCTHILDQTVRAKINLDILSATPTPTLICLSCLSSISDKVLLVNLNGGKVTHAAASQNLKHLTEASWHGEAGVLWPWIWSVFIVVLCKTATM